jgi:ribosomal protein L5
VYVCFRFDQVPKIEKIVLNGGLGAEDGSSKVLEAAMKDLTMTIGQWHLRNTHIGN